MASKLLRTGLITAALASAPSFLAAQEAAPAAPAAPEAAAPAPALTEAQQIQAQIGQIQQQAMQDPAIQAAFAEINTALETVDPEFKALTARAKTIGADVAAARAAVPADNARLNALAAEVTQLNANLATARARATAHPDAQVKVVAFRTALVKKMQEINPETQTLVARLAELNK